jgi:hypothetical protein
MTKPPIYAQVKRTGSGKFDIEIYGDPNAQYNTGLGGSVASFVERNGTRGYAVYDKKYHMIGRFSRKEIAIEKLIEAQGVRNRKIYYI